jgi:hypothetical protein
LRIRLGVVVCALGVVLFGPFDCASRVLCWWVGFRDAAACVRATAGTLGVFAADLTGVVAAAAADWRPACAPRPAPWAF